MNNIYVESRLQLFHEINELIFYLIIQIFHQNSCFYSCFITLIYFYWMKTYFMKKIIRIKTSAKQQKEEQMPFLRLSGLLNRLHRSSKTPLPNHNRQDRLEIKTPPLKGISQRDISSPEKLPTIKSLLLKVSQSSLKKIDSTNLMALNLTTRSWCLFDLKTQKYLGLRQQYKRQIASLTKIMTSLLATQFIQKKQLPLNCIVKVTKIAAGMIGTTADLKAHHWMSIEDLLYGTMLPSGNDAAYTLAEYIGYCLFLHHNKNTPDLFFSTLKKIDLSGENTTIYVQQFIHQMNSKAIKLNLLNTCFSNPHGLQNALNASSAKDIIKLCVAASKNQMFKKVVSTISYKYELFEGSDFKKRYLREWCNTNILLQKGWQGLKTGQTITAGSCLASQRGGIYIVVLNCSNSATRFKDTEKIYQWYTRSPQFENQSRLQLTQNNSKVFNLMKISTEQTEDSIF